MSDRDELNSDRLSGPTIDRRTTMKLLGMAGMASLAGCTGNQEGSQETTDSNQNENTQESDNNVETPSEGKTGGRLQAGWFTGDMEILDPPAIPTAINFQVTANIFNGLVKLNKDLTISGDLATDWSLDNDGKRYTFDLREGVQFHNGTEFTAEDVEYTITRTIENDMTAASKLTSLQSPSDGGVNVIDDYTVELNFQEKMAPALVYLTRGPGRAATIVNQEAIEEMGEEQYALTPVGTGPFQVTGHEVGSSITLDAFDEYFETDENGNQLPYLDGIDINLIPEAATIVNAIRSGDLDFINEVPLQNVGEIEDGQGVEKASVTGINWSGLGMNTEREPFTSPEARLGIAKVLDEEAFVDGAFFGNALANAGVISEAYEWAWRDDKPADQEYAPEEGQQLLEDAGVMGESFSILAQQGDLRASQIIRQQLNQVGLNVEIEQVTSSTYWDRVYDADFDTTVVGSAGDPDPDQGLYNFFRKYEDDGVWNFVRYSDDSVHEMLAEQRRLLDREQRKEALWEIEDHLIGDAPWAFLYHQDDILAKQTYVSGFEHIPFMRNFHTVWLDN